MMIFEWLEKMLTASEFAELRAYLQGRCNLSNDLSYMLRDYKDWFKVLSEAGLIDQLSFIPDHKEPEKSSDFEEYAIIKIEKPL